MHDKLFWALLNRVRFYDKITISYDMTSREYTIHANQETVFHGSEPSLIDWLEK